MTITQGFSVKHRAEFQRDKTVMLLITMHVSKEIVFNSLGSIHSCSQWELIPHLQFFVSPASLARTFLWKGFSTNSKCLIQQRLPSWKGPWQEYTSRNLSLLPTIILIKYCGKTTLMIVSNARLEICGFGYVSFSS